MLHIRSRQPLAFLYIGFCSPFILRYCARDKRKSTCIMQAPSNGRNCPDQAFLHDEYRHMHMYMYSRISRMLRFVMSASSCSSIYPFRMMGTSYHGRKKKSMDFEVISNPDFLSFHIDKSYNCFPKKNRPTSGPGIGRYTDLS